MSDKIQNIQLTAEIPSELTGKRLDQALAIVFNEHSRSRIKEWIDKEEVKVNGVCKRPRDKVMEGDRIEINAVVEVVSDWLAEPIELNIVFEDEHILVINKPAGLVVHPAVGNRAGTLVNALLHRLPQLNQVPRAGVVHRLDKNTTGLMVVAKTLIAQTSLVSQLQARTVKRTYEAVVCGVLTSGGKIEARMARHPHDRVRMAVVELGGKPAITHYRVIERFKGHTHVRVMLETGRTHQIRVHMAFVHYPIVGDKVYGGRLRLPPNISLSLQEKLRIFPRQALHAKNLSFLHPVTQEEMSFETALPEDIQALLQALKTNT